MKKLSLSLLVLPFLATSALAHSPYLKPNTFTPDPKIDHVTVEAAFAEGALRPEIAMKADGWAVIGPDGVKIALTPAASLKDATFLEVPLTANGTYRITSGERTGRVAKAGLKDGALRFIEGPEGAKPDETLVDVQSVTRADVYISRGTPTAVGAAEAGVEIHPVTAPNDAYAGEAVKISVLDSGKPVAGAHVTVMRDGQIYEAQKTPELELTSDAKGEVSFTPAAPGLYLIQTRVRNASATHAALWISHTATLTLEVLPQ
jgi:uncharacterized GH25 family protein